MNLPFISQAGQILREPPVPGIVDVDNAACGKVCEAHDVNCMPTLALVEAKLKPWDWMTLTLPWLWRFVRETNLKRFFGAVQETGWCASQWKVKWGMAAYLNLFQMKMNQWNRMDLGCAQLFGTIRLDGANNAKLRWSWRKQNMTNDAG